MSGFRQEDFDDCKSLIEKTTYLTGRFSGFDLITALVSLLDSTDKKLSELKSNNIRLRNWTMDCKNEILFPLSHQDNELGMKAELLSTLTVDLLREEPAQSLREIENNTIKEALSLINGTSMYTGDEIKARLREKLKENTKHTDRMKSGSK